MADQPETSPSPPVRLSALYQRYARWIPIAAFILGFVFDSLVLRRIDEPKVILQQAAYLALSGTLIAVELPGLGKETGSCRPSWLARAWTSAWNYREALLHFLLGTLLNSYTIFYFKSASASSSFLFIALLAGLLTVNEFKHFGRSQAKVHVAFWSLCLTSWFVSLVPILLGTIGRLPFALSVTATFGVFALYTRLLRKRLSRQEARLELTHLWAPFLAVQATFALLYLFNAIPPVPLSVTYMGIFHDVRRSGRLGLYELSREPRSSWLDELRSLVQEETFHARPGDAIHCFVQVFSPARFRERLHIRWLYQDPARGWTSSDSIPLPIVGGREEGYRGSTTKANYQPGHWQIRVETSQGQEVARLGFTVAADEATGDRELEKVFR